MTMSFDGQGNGVADTTEDALEQATMGRRRLLLGGVGGAVEPSGSTAATTLMAATRSSVRCP